MGNLDMADPPVPNGMLITDAKVSPFIVDLIDELGYVRVSSVASGNRAMMLLEGKGGAYIRDTGGFSKWDTSAPTAVIEVRRTLRMMGGRVLTDSLALLASLCHVQAAALTLLHHLPCCTPLPLSLIHI